MSTGLRPHPLRPALRARLAVSAVLALVLTPAPSMAQLGDLCRRSADRYALLSLRRATKPERVAETYVEVFTTKRADREAQEVWRRMSAEGSSLEHALTAHIARYHRDRPSNEQATLRAEVTDQIRIMTLIRDLVLAFESTSITVEAAADVMEKAWRKQTWTAPHPIERYVRMVREKAKAYKASNLDHEQAAVRAAVETQAALDRDRGVPRGSIVDKGSACYKDALNLQEISLRARLMDPLTEAERAEAASRDT